MKKIVLLCLMFFFCLQFTYSQHVTLDPSFGNKGIVTAASGSAYSNIAIQKDGKIVVIGTAKKDENTFTYFLARYNTDGSPDNTFSEDGIQVNDFDITSVAIQNDQKIVVAKRLDSGYIFARYNIDGSIDKTFSGNGKLTINFGATLHSPFSDKVLFAIQKDDKIVAAAKGFVVNDEGTVDGFIFFLARYNSDGTLDDTFKLDTGVTFHDLFSENGSPSSLGIQSNGEIVIAGNYETFRESLPTFIFFDSNGNFSNIKWQEFGAVSVVIQSDDKMILFLEYRKRGTNSIPFARYNPDGSLDTTLSGDGMQTAHFGFDVYTSSITIQNDKKIVITAWSKANKFAIARYNSDGSLDSAFSNDEIETTFSINHIAISDEKLYAAGENKLARYVLDDSSNTPPTVSITNPTNNATYGAGAYIKINAAASDADGIISKVEFYNGNTLLHIEYVTPYGYQWKHVPAGNYSLTVKATDNSGLVTTSAPVHITVVPNIASTVNIVNPANNQTIAGPSTIRLTAAAKDPDGTITKVQFYNGTTLLRTETLGPYTYTWEDVPVGNYTITAKATDNWGVVTTSAVVNISVAPNIAPTISIINPPNQESFISPATIPLIASAKDPDGTISRVEFYNGTTLLNTQYISPYTHTMRDVPAGTYTITAKAIDNLGLSTTSAPVTITVTGTNTSIASSKPTSENNITGVKDAISLKVYPNPARNIVNIYTKGLQQNKQATISVISAFGAVMKTMQLKSSNQIMQVDVSSLRGGVFTIKVISGNKVVYKQFVKL